VTPDFDDLVDSQLERGERLRLERVHELLIAAGPPPEPTSNVVRLPTRRTRGRLVALVAAVAVAAFAFGAALVDGSAGRSVDFTEAMHGTSAAPDAKASLVVFDVDTAGNWPMEISVDGLPPARSGRPFELWLTRDGELDALCGAFLTDAEGAASVPMNAPYPFDERVGWVIVEEGTTMPLLTT
jgi:hypothetical protein